MKDQKVVLEKIKRLVKELRREYTDDPNVQSIGWGLPERGGDLTEGVSLIFYVRRKYPTARAVEAAGSRPIPDEIDGIPTDVQELHLRPSQAGDRDEIKYDPLRGGVASSNAEENILWFNGSGTLGVLARDADTNAPVALSNWHVWGDGGEAGDRIIQPGHPTTGDHLEAIGKVAACGPLITSLIEWTVPSPLALALYGGAAAAAIAAAASDYRDPTRRGQDHTLTDPGERTLRETVDMAIEYPELPLPGRPFRTEVKWDYARETGKRLLTHAVEEERVNPQFLLGKLVVTDRATYRPGDTVRLTAAIWDYQPRPCDAYHAVAHLVPHNAPDRALRAVLQPTSCPRRIPLYPPTDPGEEKQVCLIFDEQRPGEYPYKGRFQWLTYLHPAQEPVHIVDWLNGTPALYLPHGGLRFSHFPASRVTVRVAHFTGQPVTLTAYNASGTIIGVESGSVEQGVIQTLSVVGEGIVGTELSGGGGEGVLVEYCILPLQESLLTTTLEETLVANIKRELPRLSSLEGQQVRGHRCCFNGEILLPPTETPGKWDVYLTVQNVNHVLADTPPEEAAQVIGGHLLSAHTSPEILGCTIIMLLDHAFDVI